MTTFLKWSDMLLDKVLEWMDFLLFVPLSETDFARFIIDLFKGSDFAEILEFYLDVPLVGFILLELLFWVFCFKLLKFIGSCIVFFWG